MKPSLIRAFRRFLMCAVVITGIATTGLLLAPQEAVAIPCCEVCDAVLTNCLAKCGGAPGCEDNCQRKADQCLSQCFPCL